MGRSSVGCNIVMGGAVADRSLHIWYKKRIRKQWIEWTPQWNFLHIVEAVFKRQQNADDERSR